MDSGAAPRIVFVGTQFLSMFACIWFLRSFFSFQKKTIAIKAIAILSATDLSLHFIAALFISFPMLFVNAVGAFLVNYILRFSIFCACNIALQVFRSISRSRKNESEQQYRWSVLFTLMLAAIFTFL